VVQRRAADIRAALGNPRRILLGVDRLDYTKGIDVRLRAVRELFAEGELVAGDVTMVQIATPSRERVEHYRQMREVVEREVGRINGDFGRVGHPAVHYLHAGVEPRELAAFYLAGDVAMVTPLRDGMNLVCKEYVATRHDLGGALVLSEFTGAAGELDRAFLVNPFHLNGVKRAVLDALAEPEAQRRDRMRAMRRRVFEHDVDHWANSFLHALDVDDQPAVTA
jgi:trehalose 6-phosphate synthase